uniref:Uncharacterized protein n=1 Tax=viral metagenome TaxID=1070528 RepID=A0A6M3KAF5_9ZZZZ
MDANILCTLLAQRIPPEQFQLWGLDIHWMAPEYDTPENRAIVEDVVANYASLAAGVVAVEQLAKLKNRLKQELKETASSDAQIFRMMLAIWDVGVTKGLWVNADLPTPIRAVAAQWKQKLQEIDS